VVIVIGPVIEGFIALFVIMDPLGVIPLYLPLVSGMDDKERNHTVYLATGFATVLLIVFLFGGGLIFEYLQIRLEHIMVAGGVVLVLLGFEAMFGGEGTAMKRDSSIAIVPVGMPFMAGPGSIATVLLLMAANGTVVTIISIALVMAVQFFIYLWATKIVRFAGKNGLKVMANIAAVAAASFGIQLMINGFRGIF